MGVVMTETQGLIDRIGASVIGDDAAFVGPFGPRRVTYADYTASGRSLTFVEDYIRDQVMPLYANTHTESSGTGLQTGRFREDARDIIRRAVGATRQEHAVIFCGSGTTGAVDKLVAILNLRIPADLDRRYDLRSRIPAAERPVVFIGPYEHHSNELPWRESIADVVTIREDADGHIDLAHLEASSSAMPSGRCASARSRPPPTSPASSPTPARSPSLLHRHGALAFWDFGAAAPYVDIRDVAPPGRRRCRGQPRGRARSTRRTRSSSRPTSSSAVPARQGCSSSGGTCSPTACRRSSGAARSRT